MKKKTAIFIAICAMAFWFISSPEARCESKTDDLASAYNSEYNAFVKYLNFAKKAEDDGYFKVANLFKATAKSSEVMAKNYSKMLKKLGNDPKVTISSSTIGSTKENLGDAIKDSAFACDTQYPEFIDRAKNKVDNDQLELFTWAKKIKGSHIKLYSKALQNIEDWKVKGVLFYDCGKCGNTVEKVDFKLCPVCNKPIGRYMKVKERWKKDFLHIDS